MSNAEALRLARNALKDCRASGKLDDGEWKRVTSAIAAIDALAQPAASGEPVAFGFPNSAITGSNRWMMLRESVPADDQYGGALWVPLYAAPQPAPARVPLPERLVRFTLRDLKAERARLDGFLALGNELARAAEYDEWIAALEAYCDAHDITPAPTAAQADQSNPQR